MIHTSLHTVVALGILGLAGSVTGQHADFVLFGDSNKEAANATAEQTFVHPLTSPYYHEDSFVTSDIRAWYVYHSVPGGSTLDGGNVNVAALQLRLALTDQIQLVAYKDGYTWIDTGLAEESGWNDIAAGLKWNFIQDWEHQFHMAVGAGYQFPWGDDDVLQDDSVWRVWASVNKGFGKVHLGATVNGLFGDNSDDGLGSSDYLVWNLHADYYLTEKFSPVLEFNGYHTFSEGNVVIPESGIDVANLGGGDDVITMGLGGEFRFTEQLAARAAYEFPLTSNEDIFGWRLTFSVVFSF